MQLHLRLVLGSPCIRIFDSTDRDERRSNTSVRFVGITTFDLPDSLMLTAIYINAPALHVICINKITYIYILSNTIFHIDYSNMLHPQLRRKRQRLSTVALGGNFDGNVLGIPYAGK